MSHEESLTQKLKGDLPASIVVFLVALPLCLGIALASGAPLISGLIAGIVGGIVVGGLSGSPLGVSGPAAGLAVIVLHAIQDLGAFEVFLVAVVLAGCLQVLLGFLRAGVIAYYFPSAVITGMLAGIGIIIFIKQIPHAIGFNANGTTEGTWISNLGNIADHITFGPMVIAAISLAILILWQRDFFKNNKVLSIVPGPLVAVTTGIVLGEVFASTSLSLTAKQFVSIPIVEGIEGFKSLLVFPDFSALSNLAIFKVALTLAVVGSLETLLCVEATDKLDPLKRVTPTNRELKAQGVGNIISGMIGGLPITQVIVRSSANIQSGGKSKMSAIIHGFFLIASVAALPTLLNRIPLATLAAILFLVGYKLAKPALFKKMFSEGKAQFIPFIATILGIVFTDLLIGVGIGLAIGIASLMIENYQLPFQIDHLPQEEGESVRIKLAQQVSFLNKASILKSLSTIPDGAKVEIDGTHSVYVHADVIEIIDNFVIGAEARAVSYTHLTLPTTPYV